jgi:hypothetical protein
MVALDLEAAIMHGLLLLLLRTRICNIRTSNVLTHVLNTSAHTIPASRAKTTGTNKMKCCNKKTKFHFTIARRKESRGTQPYQLRSVTTDMKSFNPSVLRFNNYVQD